MPKLTTTVVEQVELKSRDRLKSGSRGRRAIGLYRSPRAEKYAGKSPGQRLPLLIFQPLLIQIGAAIAGALNLLLSSPAIDLRVIARAQNVGHFPLAKHSGSGVVRIVE